MKFTDCQSLIQDADVLLFPRRSLISIAGRSKYSHAGMAKWWGGQLMLLEYREWIGGRAIVMAHEVKRRASIDVYRPLIAAQDRLTVSEQMLAGIGEPYDYYGILRASLLHLPFARIFAEPKTTDSRDWQPKARFCSAGVAAAFGPKYDLVPNMDDDETEPGDLGRSALLKFQFTIDGEKS